MKTYLKKLGVAAIAGSMLLGSYAMADTQSFTVATVVADNLVLTVVNGLDFGTIAISCAGSYALNTDDTVGATTCVSQYAGTPDSADFTIAGTASTLIDITLPAAAVTLDDGLGNQMTVDTWITDATGSQLTLSGAGAGAFAVSATLTYAGIVPDGTYTAANGSGDPTVTIAYN